VAGIVAVVDVLSLGVVEIEEEFKSFFFAQVDVGVLFA